MSKKKRLFGLFAIMFVAIFSVGCVFATACKKNKNKDEESEPEHVHAYTELKQDGANGHYYICPDDGEKGEVTAHTYGEWTGTEADCVNDANRTRSCTVCGYVDTDTTAATGNHTYVLKEDATWAWAKDEDGADDYSAATADAVCSVCGADGQIVVEATFVAATGTCTTEGAGTYTVTYEGKEVLTQTVGTSSDAHTYSDESSVSWSWTGVTSATANVACDVCGETTGVSASVSGPTGGVYKATATTPANKEVNDTKAAPATAPTDTVKSEVIDFSVAADTQWITRDSSEDQLITECTSTSGLLTIPSGGKMKLTDTRGGALNTNGKTSSSGPQYVQINLSEYKGYNLMIVATMCSNSNAERSLYVGTKIETPSLDSKPGLAHATSSSATDVQTLGYGIGKVATIENDVLYLTCDNSVNILTLEVYVYGNTEKTPETHTHNYNLTWNWSDDYSSCTATWTCEVDGCPDDGKTYTATATVASSETAPTCTEAGYTTYTATVTNSTTSEPYTDTKVVAGDSATGHTYPVENGEGYTYSELVTWGWDDLTEYTSEGKVQLTVTCPECETEIINEEVDYQLTQNTDGSKTLTASYTVANTTITYTNTRTIPVPEIELANRVVAIPQGEEISYKASDAEASATFSNASTIEVAFDGTTNTFTLSGTASTMSGEQAAAFWPGTAAGGDAYVIIGVYSNVGETITFTSSDKEKSFAKEEYDDDLAVIIRITSKDGSIPFSITDTATGSTKASFTVSFAGIEIPQKADSAESIQEMIDAAAEEATTTGANASVTITLAGEISGSITIKAGTDVTLDLAGFAITGESNVDAETGTAYTIIVEAGASLTITDGTGNGTVKCTYAATNNENSRLGAAIYVNGGDLIIEGGEIDSTSVGVLAEAGTVKMEGGKISSTYYTLWLARGEVTACVGGDAVMTGERGIFVAGDCKYGYDGYSTDENCVTKLYVYGNAQITTTFGSAISTLGLSNKETVYVYILGGTINGRAVEYENETEKTTVMPAIYMPNGNLYIYGGTIAGTTAVEMRGGTLVIEGGTLVSTAGTQYTNYNSTGASTYGYALAVYPYLITKRDNEEGFDNSLSVSVTGGTFTGKIFNWSVDKDAGQTDYEYEFSITGGFFSEDPSAYLGVNYKATLVTDGGEHNGYYAVELISITGTWTGEIEFEITGVKDVLKEALGDLLGSILGSFLDDEYTITATATLKISESGVFELTLTDYGCDASVTLGSTSYDIGEYIVGILKEYLDDELCILGTWSWTAEEGYVAHMEDDDLGTFYIPVTVKNIDGVDTLCISADVELDLEGLEIGFVIDNQTATRAEG